MNICVEGCNIPLMGFSICKCIEPFFTCNKNIGHYVGSGYTGMCIMSGLTISLIVLSIFLILFPCLLCCTGCCCGCCGLCSPLCCLCCVPKKYSYKRYTKYDPKQQYNLHNMQIYETPKTIEMTNDVDEQYI